MLRNLLLGLLFAASFSAFAFDKQECAVLAANVAAAQNVLNQDPALFKEVHETVKKTDPAKFGMSKDLMAQVIRMVETLKPGADPNMVGEIVFEGCNAKLI